MILNSSGVAARAVTSLADRQRTGGMSLRVGLQGVGLHELARVLGLVLDLDGRLRVQVFGVVARAADDGALGTGDEATTFAGVALVQLFVLLVAGEFVGAEDGGRHGGGCCLR